MTTFESFWMRAATLVACAALVVAQTSCGGDHAAAPVATTSPLQIYGTAANSVTVTLPQGTSVTPEQVTVITSVSKKTPAANGSVSIDAYAAGGSEIAVVLSPKGTPMLLGWLDANHHTIDASTTAEVLAYFTLGGELLLNDSDRSEMIAGIPGAGGFQALVQVVNDQIAANSEAFAANNTALTAAVNAFFTAATAGAASAVPAAASSKINALVARSFAHPEAVNVTPDTQSGLTVTLDPPFAAHIVNTYRRRSYAYVERVSHTIGVGTAAVETPDPAAITDFEVAPVIGLTGGINGTVSDIVSAYFGVQTTAYGPVSSPSTGTFATPLVSGSDKTTYKVTVVGPGAPNDAAIAALTAAQNDERIKISVIGFCNDVIIPFFGNVIFGSSLFPGSGRQPSATLSKFKAAFINNLENDIFLALPTLGTLQDKIITGHYADAAKDIAYNGLTGNALQGIVEKAIQETYTALALAGPTDAFGSGGPSSLSVAMSNITRILGVAGAALQVFDTAVYTAQGAGSDAVNVWTLNASKQKVVVSPATAPIDVGGFVSLTADVQGVEDPTTTFSYQWTTTTQIGDLTELGNSARTMQTSYCSSSNMANFVYEKQAPLGTQDTVTVQAFSAPNCVAANALGAGTSVMTFTPSTTVAVSPATAQGSPGAAIALTATLGSRIIDPDAIVNYQWTVKGGIGGSLTDPTTGAPTQSYTSASASASYNAPSDAQPGEQDSVQVTVIVGSKANPSLSITVAAATAVINFASVDLSGWVGDFMCGDGITTLSFFTAPYTNSRAPTIGSPPAAGINLLVLIHNNQNYGVAFYWLVANSTTAIDYRGQTNPGTYNFALTLSGGTVSGYSAGACSK
jgi:hypothetical protein